MTAVAARPHPVMRATSRNPPGVAAPNSGPRGPMAHEQTHANDLLRRHGTRELARTAGVDRKTAQRAQHGLPVHPMLHAALVAAAQKLDAARPAATAPVAPVAGGCAQQCGGHVYRRGLCRNCYRKFRAAGLAMPPPGKRGYAPYTLVRRMKRWLGTLTADQLAALRGALERSA